MSEPGGRKRPGEPPPEPPARRARGGGGGEAAAEAGAEEAGPGGLCMSCHNPVNVRCPACTGVLLLCADCHWCEPAAGPAPRRQQQQQPPPQAHQQQPSPQPQQRLQRLQQQQQQPPPTQQQLRQQPPPVNPPPPQPTLQQQQRLLLQPAGAKLAAAAAAAGCGALTARGVHGSLPGLGCNLWTVEAPAGTAPEAAAAALSEAVGSSHCLFFDAPRADGPVVSWVWVPALQPGAAGVALASAPGAPKVGWGSQRALAAGATPADISTAATVVVLPRGGSLEAQPEEQLGTAGAACRGAALASEALLARAPPDLAGRLGAAADVAANVAQQLLLLPAVGSDMTPAAGLYVLQLAADACLPPPGAPLAAAQQAAQRALAACDATSPAGLWRWFAGHAAVGHASGAARHHLRHLLPGDAARVCALAAAASSVQLDHTSRLPLVLCGAARFSPFSARHGAGPLVVLLAKRRLRAARDVSMPALAEALQGTGLAPALGPLVPPGKVASRPHIQLFMLRADGSGTGDAEAAITALNTAAKEAKAGVFLDITCFLQEARSGVPPDKQPLPLHLSNALAKAVRAAMSRRRTGASPGAEEVDLSEMEGRFMATSGPLAAQLVTEDYEERLTMLSTAVCAGVHPPDQPQQEQTAAPPPPPSEPGIIHILVRTSGGEGAGKLDQSISQQAQCCMAIVAAIFPPHRRPAVIFYPEACSVHKHAPSDREALRLLLKKMRPGDLVLAASPDRFDRTGSRLRELLQKMGGAGCAVGVAAVGPHTIPSIILLEDGGQLAGQPQVQAAISRVATAVCDVASVAAEALAELQGVYTGQHAFMSRVVAAGSQPSTAAAGQPCGVVTDVLRALRGSRPTVYFCRTSELEQDGSSAALAGAASARQLVTGSLKRQHAFLDIAAGIPQGSIVVSANGVSVAPCTREPHPLLEAIKSGTIPAGALVLATSLDRLSRTPGLLAKLRAAAEARGIIIATLLQDAALVGALAPDFAAGALGALSQQLPAGVAAQLNAQVAPCLTAAQPAANNMPVLLPVLVTASVQQEQQEGRGAAFAAGRGASFSNTVSQGLAAAAAAGLAAFVDSMGQQRAPHSRGLGPGFDTALLAGAAATAAAVDAARQAAAEADGTEAEAEEPAAAAAQQQPACFVASQDNKGSWTCTCKCRAGQPVLACRCDCQRCRRAREGLCPCSCARAAGKSDSCTCPPFFPCTCSGCHERPGAAPEAAGAVAAPCICRRAGCGKPAAKRTGYCASECYAADEAAAGRDARRCASGPACVSFADGQAAIVVPGDSFGTRCKGCYRRMQSGNNAAAAGAAAAGAAAAGAAAAGAAAAGAAAAGAAGAAAVARQPQKRGKVKPWTAEAIAALVEGVAEHGRSWKSMQEADPRLQGWQSSAVGRKWDALVKAVRGDVKELSAGNGGGLNKVQLTPEQIEEIKRLG